MTRFVIAIENASAGAGVNPAIQTHHLDNPGAVSDEQMVAQLIAFSQYQSCAAGTYISSISIGADAPGPTLPQAFPVTEYGALQAVDADIVPMVAWGDQFGTGNLAPLGVGQVLSKRSTLPGRTGRGRLTTPWLRTAAVSNVGIGILANLTFLADGYLGYLHGDHVALPGSIGVDLGPFIYPSMALVVNATTTTRLGRVRSRGK